MHPIRYRWIFAKKRTESGQVIRYKARLVAKRFKQKFGVDSFKTFSPGTNMHSIRMAMTLVVTEGYVTEQLDADAGF
ncbi:putative reverse transcriptase, RNA-dependent DNA polymerase [Plasmopara halstedii]